jgi:hypothetical protein
VRGVGGGVAVVVKRVLIGVIVVIAIIAVVNDVGRYIIVWYTLDETTRETSEVAASTDGTREDAARAAAAYAQTQDVVVYAYDEKDGKVYVWTEKELGGAWFLDSILLAVRGDSPSGPYVLKAEHSRVEK